MLSSAAAGGALPDPEPVASSSLLSGSPVASFLRCPCPCLHCFCDPCTARLCARQGRPLILQDAPLLESLLWPHARARDIFSEAHSSLLRRHRATRSSGGGTARRSSSVNCSRAGLATECSQPAGDPNRSAVFQDSRSFANLGASAVAFHISGLLVSVRQSLSCAGSTILLPVLQVSCRIIILQLTKELLFQSTPEHSQLALHLCAGILCQSVRLVVSHRRFLTQFHVGLLRCGLLQGHNGWPSIRLSTTFSQEVCNKLESMNVAAEDCATRIGFTRSSSTPPLGTCSPGPLSAVGSWLSAPRTLSDAAVPQHVRQRNAGANSYAAHGLSPRSRPRSGILRLIWMSFSTSSEFSTTLHPPAPPDEFEALAPTVP